MSGASRRATDPRIVLQGHSAPVNDIEICPDRDVLYSGDAKGTVKIWDLAAASEMASFKTKEGIRSLHPVNEREIVTLNKAGRVELWDTELIGSGERSSSADKLTEPKMDFATQAPGFAKGCSIRPDSDDSDDYDGKMLLASPSSEDGEIDVFCIEDQKRTHTVALDPGLSSQMSRTGLAFCIDLIHGNAGQPLLVGGFEDGRLAIWDLRSCSRPLSNIKIFKEAVMTMSVSLPRRMIVTGSAEKAGVVLKISDSLDEMEVKTTIFYGQAVTNYELHKRIYALIRTQITNSVAGSSEGAYGGSIRFKGDYKLFACGGWDGNIRTFHTKTIRPVSILKYHVNTVSAIKFHHESLISASLDHTIAIWPV